MPVTEYLSEKEIQTYLAYPDSSNLEDKVDEWRTHAIFEEFYQGILTKAKSLEIPELTPKHLVANKDTLLAAIIESSDSTEAVLEVMRTVFHTDAVFALRDTVNVLLHTLEHDFDVIMQVGTNNYLNRVVMPGLLLDTNADAVEGNMAQWDFPGDVFEFRNKVMWAESRMINWWGIGFSTGVLVLLLLLLLVKRAQKEKK